jgi:hypothetical protein
MKRAAPFIFLFFVVSASSLFAYPFTLVSLDRFDDAGRYSISWTGDVPSGLGASLASVPGGPLGVDPKESGDASGTPLSLGLRLDIQAAGRYEVSIRAEKPIPLPGRMRSLSFWAYGLNRGFELWLDFADSSGRIVGRVLAGTLNYMGWKKLSVYIPVEFASIPLSFAGFRVRMEPLSLQRGVACLYFDSLCAEAEDL